MDVTKVVLENFDKEISSTKRSGKHVKTSAVHGLYKIVAEPVSLKEVVWSPGRAYNYYSNLKTSLLENLDMQEISIRRTFYLQRKHDKLELKAIFSRSKLFLPDKD